MLQQKEAERPKKKFPEIRDIPGTFTRYPNKEEIEEHTKMKAISFKVNPEERERLMAEAKKNHMTISSYVRKLIIEKGFGYLDVKDMPEYHQELRKEYRTGWEQGIAEEHVYSYIKLGASIGLVGILFFFLTLWIAISGVVFDPVPIVWAALGAAACGVGIESYAWLNTEGYRKKKGPVHPEEQKEI